MVNESVTTGVELWTFFFLGFEGDKRGWGERKTRRNVERDEENEWRGAVTGSHTYTGELACALPSSETGEPHSRTRNKLIINRFKANFDSCLFDIFTAVFVRKNFHLPSRVAVGLLGCFLLITLSYDCPFPLGGCSTHSHHNAWYAIVHSALSVYF